MSEEGRRAAARTAAEKRQIENLARLGVLLMASKWLRFWRLVYHGVASPATVVVVAAGTRVWA